MRGQFETDDPLRFREHAAGTVEVPFEDLSLYVFEPGKMPVELLGTILSGLVEVDRVGHIVGIGIAIGPPEIKRNAGYRRTTYVAREHHWLDPGTELFQMIASSLRHTRSDYIESIAEADLANQL